MPSIGNWSVRSRPPNGRIPSRIRLADDGRSNRLRFGSMLRFDGSRQSVRVRGGCALRGPPRELGPEQPSGGDQCARSDLVRPLGGTTDVDRERCQRRRDRQHLVNRCGLRRSPRRHRLRRKQGRDGRLHLRPCQGSCEGRSPGLRGAAGAHSQRDVGHRHGPWMPRSRWAPPRCRCRESVKRTRSRRPCAGCARSTVTAHESGESRTHAGAAPNPSSHRQHGVSPSPGPVGGVGADPRRNPGRRVTSGACPAAAPKVGPPPNHDAPRATVLTYAAVRPPA